mgnify:CR=1 FL=1
MVTDPEILKKILAHGGLMPQEEMLEIAKRKGSLNIGIPKETSFQERRVALVPEAVSLLVSNGHHVKIETNSGEGANFSDNEYSEAGAEICYDSKEIFSCDIIFKVAPPSELEVELMPGGQTLISALQLSIQPKVILQKLMDKKITAIAWDYIKDEETGQNKLKEGAELRADGVMYDRLTVLLIKGMQEQQKTIKDLEARIIKLESK